MSVDDLLRSLQMPDTVALEVPSNTAGGGGFVIVRYATPEAESLRAFREYFLNDVFGGWSEFSQRGGQPPIPRLADRGPIASYFAEFVSRRGRAISAACTVLAAYRERVCHKRLGVTNFPVRRQVPRCGQDWTPLQREWESPRQGDG